MDNDGVGEIGALGTVYDASRDQHVDVLSIYSSTWATPIVTLAGDGAVELLQVLDGRAKGNRVDWLLNDVPEWTDSLQGFSLARSAAGQSIARGTFGSASSGGGSSSNDDSSSCTRSSSFCGYFELPRIVFSLRDDPWSWSENIEEFIKISLAAADRADVRYPLDPGRNNAFRHAMWQYQLRCRFGVVTAKEIGDIHEDYSPNACDTAIDQYNNKIARDLAAAIGCSLSESALEDEIVRRIGAGEFIVSPSDPRVIPPCPEQP